MSDLAIVALLIVALGVIPVLAAVGLATAGYSAEEVAAIIGVIAGISITPVSVVLVQWLNRRLGSLPTDVRQAAAAAYEAKVNTEEIKTELNGKQEAKMRRIVREEAPLIVEEAVRRVLMEMNLSCPREEGAGVQPGVGR